MSSSKVNWEKWRRAKAPFEDILGKYQTLILREFCKGKTLLDIGCGDGTLCSNLVDKFEKVYGIDENQNLIHKARKLIPTGNFTVNKIENYYPIQKFDTIIMISVLEHISNPKKILTTISKWLSDNGVLIIHVPNANSLNRMLGKKMNLLKNTRELSKHDLEVGHMQMYDLHKLKKMVYSTGFEVIHSGGFLLKAHPNHQMQKLYRSNLWENNKMKQRYFDALFELGKEYPDIASTIYVNCKKK